MKAYLITGISSGLGKAIFEELCIKECFIFAIDRVFLPTQVKQARSNNRIHLFIQDLSHIFDLTRTLELISNLFDSSIEEFVFVNNAAIISPIGEVGTLSLDDINCSACVNFIAPCIITNFFCNYKKKNGFVFKICNVSTGAAEKPIVGWSMYCATKAATKMFFNVVDKQGIADHVLQIDPGVMDTPMQNTIRSASKNMLPAVDIFIQYHESGRLISPSSVARSILAKI